MRNRPRSTSNSRRRSGIGIVEVLVALVVTTIGLLAVAGSCALSIRVSAAAARERRGAQRASVRVALLASQGCGAARGGSLTDPAAGLTERWAVSAPTNGVALVDADAVWATSSGTRAVYVRSAMLC